jgi:hypothetical protein
MKQSIQTLSDRQRRWRAPLVTSVVHLLMFESMSGFLLFFFGPFLPTTEGLGTLHWWIGVLFLLPYTVYQLRHYLRVASHQGKFHFNLGLSSFAFMCVVVLSGILMWAAGSRTTTYYVVVDLVHIVIGFALLIMISSHLVLVFRVGKREESEIGAPAAQRRIMARILWVPLAMSSLALGVWWLLR